MSCRACTRCEANPRNDEYTAGCESCKARALAAIGAHIDSQAAKVITPHYREVLEKVFGERWREGGEIVKKWAAKMDAAVRRKVTA